MTEDTLETPALDLDGLIAEASKGDATDWALIEENLKKLDLAEDYVIWSTNIGLMDANDGVRDLAATILDISAHPLTPEGAMKVQMIMANDPYHIVRYRLAIALYQRGFEHIGILHMMSEAQADPDVGELARKVWAKHKETENSPTH